MNVLLETLVHCNVHLLQHRGICQTVHLTREEKYHWGNRPDHRGGQRHWPAHGREVCPPWASLVLWDVNQEGMKETARLVKEKGSTTTCVTAVTRLKSTEWLTSKLSHVIPLLRLLHWLPVEARICYKTMVLAYGAVRGTAPPYLQALISPYTQRRALRSSTSGLLASLPLRKHSSRSAQSKLFAALAPQWWNKLPHDARTAESITTFRRHLKPHLFKEYLG
ncbi:uncharacterized protein [Salmo salar]|uniref:Uncharacterized protein n=1 Tax=Salmo salar TaxID=8030 RepID=A0ABM3CTQ5_SALSA|nr:uncharacterized protein LOC106568879 [Salmo salar]